MAEDNRNQQTVPGKMSRRIFLGVSTAAAVGAIFHLRQPSETVEAKNATQKSIRIVQFSDNGQREGVVTVQTIVKSDTEWKAQLSPDSYAVTRQAATERPYSGKYWNLHDKGIYQCICCGTAAFSSETKFESGTGWPSFWQPIAKENVRESTDISLGMERTAISCPRCNAHLGHVFDDGPRPTGLRYCMNSVALQFVKSA